MAGYGKKIAQHDFQASRLRGRRLAKSLFPTARSATVATFSISFGKDNNSIAVTDPVYPVYVDTNVMAGHTGPANESGEYGGLTYLPISAENDFHCQYSQRKS
jgi:LL-diaminopimelate aminotransferase